MRRFRRALAGMLLAATVFMAPSLGIRAHADSYDTQIAQLRSQIASLRQQLGAVGAQQQAAADAAASMEQQLAQTQSQLAATQTQLNTINAAIAATTQQLVVVNTKLDTDRKRLASTLQSIYEMQGSGYSVDMVLSAKSFSDLTQTIINLNQVNDSLKTLTDRVHTEQQQLVTLQAQQQAEQAQVTATMLQLQSLQAQQQAQEVQYQQESAALTGQAGGINSAIAADQAKIVELEAVQAAANSSSQGGWITRGNAIPPFGLGPRFDAFPWGQCTWYVASLRDVSWSGDAWAWAGNAAAHGMQEGMTPKVGAIVVWGAGNGYSGFGHVGYVAAVTSPTSFVVDEGNYLGLGIIDQRAVPSLHDVEAFIY